MSLEPRSDDGVPELTARVVRAAFPNGTLAVRIREALGPVFEDEDFVEAFPGRGRPAVSPGALALVSVLQFTEGLSDRQAAEQVRARMDWKFLLGLELDDPDFDFTVLRNFRDRLVRHGMEEKVLESVLERLSGAGPGSSSAGGTAGRCTGGRARASRQANSGWPAPMILTPATASSAGPAGRAARSTRPRPANLTRRT